MKTVQTNPGTHLSQKDFYLIGFALSFGLAGGFGYYFGKTWLLAFLIIGAGLLIFVKPFWGLLLFSVLLPIESSFLGLSGVGATVTRFVGIFIFGVWFIQLLIDRVKILIPQDVKVGIGFVAWGCLSFFWAASKNTTTTRMITAVQLLMLVVLVVNMTNSKERLRTLLNALLIGCVIVTVMGLAGVGVASYGFLLTLDDQSAKEYGSYVGLVFLLGSLSFVFEKGRNRWLGFVLFMLSMVTLIRINQRGIFLAIGIAWIVIAILTKQKLKTFLFIVMITLLFGYIVDILLALGVINELLADRLTIRNVIETGGTGRTEIWTVGLRMFTQNFLNGVGWGNFPIAYNRYIPRGNFEGPAFNRLNRGPHGDLMGVAGELGLIGLIIFIVFYMKIVLKNIRLIQKYRVLEKDILFILVFGLLIYVFSVGITSTFLWRKVYWLVLGMGIILFEVVKTDLKY